MTDFVESADCFLPPLLPVLTRTEVPDSGYFLCSSPRCKPVNLDSLTLRDEYVNLFKSALSRRPGRSIGTPSSELVYWYGQVSPPTIKRP